MSRFKATRATERMREMVAENGPCSELTALHVPLPLNPGLLLEGLLPQVGNARCSCLFNALLSSPHFVDTYLSVTTLRQAYMDAASRASALTW
jgi:hypothetical protein